MEPVTHILTGACLARTGLNRRAAYTTLAMAVAAEFPDIDTLWSLRGPVVGFEHHRGITHTFLGIPFEAALIVAGVYGLHRWRVARALRGMSGEPAQEGRTRSAGRPLTTVPVRWGLLYGFTLLALLSHLWLDYTNNYGLRPFFPFNPRWYAASITFIFDPAMFVLLLGALVLPPLFRLIGAEVGARRQAFAARGWAVAALLGVCGLWGWRAVEHSRAVALAMGQSLADPASGAPPDGPDVGIPGGAPASPTTPLRYLAAQRVLASPDPIDPRHWYAVTDFGPFYQLSSVALETQSISASNAPLQPKPQPTPAERIAEGSLLGRVYLDWSPMPFLDSGVIDGDGPVRDRGDPGPDLGPALPTGTTVVTFRDPRFLGESPWLHIARTRAPLTGTVQLNAQGAVTRETMDGKVQR